MRDAHDPVLDHIDAVLGPAPDAPSPRRQLTITLPALHAGARVLVTEWPDGRVEVDVRDAGSSLWVPLEQRGGSFQETGAQ